MFVVRGTRRAFLDQIQQEMNDLIADDRRETLQFLLRVLDESPTYFEKMVLQRAIMRLAKECFGLNEHNLHI